MFKKLFRKQNYFKVLEKHLKDLEKTSFNFNWANKTKRFSITLSKDNTDPQSHYGNSEAALDKYLTEFFNG